jgi:prepilin-type N-terminal cleavage/methylation domain-containing protein
MHSNKNGFTLFEIVVVLVLMSIVAAAVIGRSIDTREIDLSGQSDKIRNHIRFVQAMAIKRSNSVWGITCAADPNRYWVFQGTNPDDAGKQFQLPGENNTEVSLAESHVFVSAFTLFFDRFGRPYSAYTDENTNTPVTNGVPFVITVSAISGGITPKTLHITAETGFIQ